MEGRASALFDSLDSLRSEVCEVSESVLAEMIRKILQIRQFHNRFYVANVVSVASGFVAAAVALLPCRECC